MATFLWLATSLEHTTKNQKIKIRDVPVRDVVLSRQKAADRNKSLARTTSVASMVSANIRKDRRRTSKGLTPCCEWLYSPSILVSLYAYVTSPIDIDFYLSPPPSRVLSVHSCVRAAVRLCNKCNRYRFFFVGVPPLPFSNVLEPLARDYKYRVGGQTASHLPLDPRTDNIIPS